MTTVDRWPPIYDAEDLARTILQLAERGDLEARFFEPPTPKTGDYCQGDIFELTSPVPLIDEDGQAIGSGEVTLWLLLSNTCDLARDLTQVRYAQLVPLDILGPQSSFKTGELAAFRRYSYARRFYVPDWRGPPDPEVYVADFTRPVTIHRDALRLGRILARLSLPGWILLHSCLVRFLARDDGRYDVADG